MADRSRSGTPYSSLLQLLFLLAVPLAACDDDNGPPDGRTAGIIEVKTAAELDQALLTSVAGDTIEVRGEFSSATFNMTRGYTIPAERSPLRIVGIARSTLRPEIVFPANVVGLSFTGHDGSSIANLDLRGGRVLIQLDNSAAHLEDLKLSDPADHGIEATGGGSAEAIIDSCLIERPGDFGVWMTGGADLSISCTTIVDAGDCGLYIDSDPLVLRNNIVGSHNFGIFCTSERTPGMSCNNVFGSVNADYECPGLIDIMKNNFSVDPQFCPGSWFVQSTSPLAPANAGGCISIGRFGVGCDPDGD